MERWLAPAALLATFAVMVSLSLSTLDVFACGLPVEKAALVTHSVSPKLVV
jgi:hypothetical protein